jgi:putative phosphoesterase
MARLVGLISDTHGLLRAEAVAALRGVDRIVHAGDIGDAAILERLAELAPVTAVRGNNDHGAWAERLPAAASLTVDRVTFHVIHDLGELALYRPQDGTRVVVSGHSHRPSIDVRDGVLYVNPGSAGPRRFRLPISVALVTVKRGQPSARCIELVRSV